MMPQHTIEPSAFTIILHIEIGTPAGLLNDTVLAGVFAIAVWLDLALHHLWIT